MLVLASTPLSIFCLYICNSKENKTGLFTLCGFNQTLQFNTLSKIACVQSEEFCYNNSKLNANNFQKCLNSCHKFYDVSEANFTSLIPIP